MSCRLVSNSMILDDLEHNNNNNNNDPICKAPECQKTSVALAGQEQSCELNRIKSPAEYRNVLSLDLNTASEPLSTV